VVMTAHVLWAFVEIPACVYTHLGFVRLMGGMFRYIVCIT